MCGILHYNLVLKFKRNLRIQYAFMFIDTCMIFPPNWFGENFYHFLYTFHYRLKNMYKNISHLFNLKTFKVIHQYITKHSGTKLHKTLSCLK
jgi:hypothetical protein